MVCSTNHVSMKGVMVYYGVCLSVCVCLCVFRCVCMYERSTGINQDRPESYVTFGVARHFVQGHVAAVQYFRQCVSGSHDEKIPTVHVDLCLHTCCPALHALPPLCLSLYILIRCVCVCQLENITSPGTITAWSSAFFFQGSLQFQC